MRHRVAGRKLGRTTEHRWAMFRNMAAAIVQHERIETTLHKAKEMRGFADHLITLGKKGTLAARRDAFNLVRSKDLVRKIFADLAPRFKDRAGGYTRVLKLGFRHGDSAPMAIIEYVEGLASNTDKQGEASQGKVEAKKKPVKATKAPKTEKAKESKVAKKEEKKTKK
ncbi:MAG TPA: 50S ribosomal protein L17 [Deltaproteobacteria bacterium]|nr:50S ribosomal protein L17 [Deltaproteobacteria bacterium]